ncbi:MAG: DUF4430 domain-containing protein [Candidatus Heimdallarchaeota archaeon]
MGNFIEKNYQILSIAGFIVIVLVITGGLIFGPFNEILPETLREKLGYPAEHPNLETEINVQLIVDFNGFHENINETILFGINQTATAYSILTVANLTVKVREYNNGYYVEAIEGIEENSNYSWFYKVDGEAGAIASNRYDLRANNTTFVQWMYQSY